MSWKVYRLKRAWPATMEQIKNGKYMKRTFDVFMTIFGIVLEQHLDMEEMLEAVFKVCHLPMVSRGLTSEKINEIQEEFWHQLSEIRFAEIQASFDASLDKQDSIGTL